MISIAGRLAETAAAIRAVPQMLRSHWHSAMKLDALIHVTGALDKTSVSRSCADQMDATDATSHMAVGPTF